jgi:Flp pilus assembly pilin Flp
MLIVALVDVVLVTALATLGAYLYNLSSGFVGGLEVTLAEDQ